MGDRGGLRVPSMSGLDSGSTLVYVNRSVSRSFGVDVEGVCVGALRAKT